MSAFRRRRSPAHRSTSDVVVEALVSVSPYPDRVRELEATDDLTPAAVDSLAFVSMITTLEERLTIDLADAVPDLRAASTIADLVRVVDAARAATLGR